MGRPNPRGRGLMVLSAMLAALLSVTAVAPASGATPPDAALPTVQIDGVAFAQVVVGDTVFVGGRFTTARPAGAAPGRRVAARRNLLAYDLRTGRLTPWRPSTNGVVRSLAASADGATVYAAGGFTRVNGHRREHIVALSTSGRVRPAFHPRLNGTANAIAVHGRTVYAGGAFTSANGVTRTRAAAFDRSSGALRPWRPAVDAEVLALVVSATGRSAVLGGRFLMVNGHRRPGSQRVGTRSGRTDLSWRLNSVVANHGSAAAVYSLSSSGGDVYGTGYSYGAAGPRRLEGAFRASWRTGAVQWIEDCHGDSYSAARAGSVVYVVGHAHYCGNIGGFRETKPRTFHRALAFSRAATRKVAHNSIAPYSDFGGNPAPTLLPWRPGFDIGRATGQNQGPWSVVTSGRWVLIAGEFTRVNGVRQQGLVRFRS